MVDILTLADAIPEFSWVSTLVQLSTTTGAAGLLWYMIVKHVPLIEERHTSERKEWLAYIGKRDMDYELLARDHLRLMAAVQTEVRVLIEKLGKQ